MYQDRRRARDARLQRLLDALGVVPDQPKPKRLTLGQVADPTGNTNADTALAKAQLARRRLDRLR